MSIEQKLLIIANNQQRVFDAGYEKGKAEGGDTEAAFEEGQLAWRDMFWEAFQDGGKRATYAQAFHNGNFTDATFYPKYDIRPSALTYSANQMFYNWQKGNNFSLKQRLEECGVTLDLSQCLAIGSIFAYCRRITEIPTIDLRGITSYSNTASLFRDNYSSLVTIEKIITKEEITYSTWFTNTNIQNITFEGVIGNDIAFPYGTRLTYDSVMNIVEHLKDYSGTDTTKTLTLNSGIFTNDSFKAAGATEADIEALVNAKGWSLVS